MEELQDKVSKLELQVEELNNRLASLASIKDLTSPTIESISIKINEILSKFKLR